MVSNPVRTVLTQCEDLQREFFQIAYDVRHNPLCHQGNVDKLVLLLGKLPALRLVDNVLIMLPMHKFVDNIMIVVSDIIERTVDATNIYTKRALEFYGKVFVEFSKTQYRSNDNNLYKSFLLNIIPRILEYTINFKISWRFNSMKLIESVLSNIKTLHPQLIEAVYYELKDKMWARLEDDQHIHIRLLAISALGLLQRPKNPSCCIVGILLHYIDDPEEKIRREIIKHITLNKTSLLPVIAKINDVHPSVRIMVHRRLSSFTPRHLEIGDRIRFLKDAFNEYDKNVIVAFRKLMIRWVTHYGGSYVSFLRNLYNNVNDEAINVMGTLGKLITEFYLKSELIDDIIEFLPIESKLIRFDYRIEIFLYWKCVINYIRSSDDYQDYVKDIVPDLSTFCSYINSVFNSSQDIGEQIDYTWNVYQFNLLNLFEILVGYNLSDQADRAVARNIMKHALNNFNFTDDILTKIIFIYFKTCSYFNVVNRMVVRMRDPRNHHSESEFKELIYQLQELTHGLSREILMRFLAKLTQRTLLVNYVEEEITIKEEPLAIDLWELQRIKLEIATDAEKNVENEITTKEESSTSSLDFKMKRIKLESTLNEMEEEEQVDETENIPSTSSGINSSPFVGFPIDSDSDDESL